PEIATADQLRGKRIGYNGRNDQLSCALALSQIGLDLEVDVVGIKIGGKPEARLDALTNGTADAGGLSAPITYRAKQAGFRELVSLADLSSDYQSGSCVTGLVYMAIHRPVLVRFTRALYEAVGIFKSDREAALGALAEHTGSNDMGEL